MLRNYHEIAVNLSCVYRIHLVKYIQTHTNTKTQALPCNFVVALVERVRQLTFRGTVTLTTSKIQVKACSEVCTGLVYLTLGGFAAPLGTVQC